MRFDPNDFVLFRRIDFDFGGSVSWNSKPKCFDSLTKATDPCHHIASTFYWADCPPLSTGLHTCRRICIPIHCCNLFTREDPNNHTTDSVSRRVVSAMLELERMIAAADGGDLFALGPILHKLPVNFLLMIFDSLKNSISKLIIITKE